MYRLTSSTLFTLALLAAWPSWATTFTVCSSGCDETTIQDVFDKKDLAPGDIVEVHEGTYREKVTVGTNDGGDKMAYMTLKARAGDAVTISGASILGFSGWNKTAGRTNVYQESYTLALRCESMVWEDDIRLTEVIDVATCDTTDASFYHDTGANIVYINATGSRNDPSTNGKLYEVPAQTENFDDNGNDYIIFDGIDCIKTYSDDPNTVGGIKLTGSNNIVRNLSSYNHRRHSLTFYTGANDNTVTNVHFYDSASTCPVAFFSAGCQNNILENSFIHDGSANGVIYFHGGATSNWVTFCHIHNDNNRIRLVNMESSGNTIYGCLLDGTARGAFYLNFGDYNFIISCIIDAADFTDIPMDWNGKADFIHVIGNTMINGANGAYFIQADSGTNLRVYNNICVDSGRFIYVADATGLQSDYNLAYNMGTRWGNYEGTLCAALANWQAATGGQDASSLEQDPEILPDYRIPCGSPADSAGYTSVVSLGAIDIYGLELLELDGTVNMGACAGCVAEDICECDLNADGNCNILDWPLFTEDWGRTDCNELAVECECDLNSDGSCNILDWPIFSEDWGRTDCPRLRESQLAD